MNRRYRQALIVAVLGVAATLWAFVYPGSSAIALVVGSAALPAGAMLLVSGRLQAIPPLSASVGGGIIGVAIAALSHFVVFVFAYAFFLGFAEAAIELLEILRVDPRFTAAAGSPWSILLFIELALVAPITEEVGKATGAAVFRPIDRRGAFLAGVAAGTGFAIVENIFYALGGAFFGPSWEAIVIGRMLGAAVHPLASGLVVMGWWEWRQTRDLGRLTQRFLSGAGVHAIWNGSIVILSIVASAYEVTSLEGFGLASLSYSAALGAVAAAVLWRLTASVAGDTEQPVVFNSGDSRVLAAWTVLAASFLVPVAMLILAFPTFVSRG